MVTERLRLALALSGRSRPGPVVLGQLHNQQALQMIALTRDFYVVATGIAARIAAILLSIGHIAKTWNVSTLLTFFVCHRRPSDFLAPGQDRRSAEADDLLCCGFSFTRLIGRLMGRVWGKVLEHLVYFTVQLLRVLFGIAG